LLWNAGSRATGREPVEENVDKESADQVKAAASEKQPAAAA